MITSAIAISAAGVIPVSTGTALGYPLIGAVLSLTSIVVLASAGVIAAGWYADNRLREFERTIANTESGVDEMTMRDLELTAIYKGSHRGL